MNDDLLWGAALAWFHDRLKEDVHGSVPKPQTNLDHVRNPTFGCRGASEETLALAVAARLRLQWRYETEAMISRAG